MPVTLMREAKHIFLSHTFLSLPLVLAVTLPAMLSTASAESLKIGVVDTQRVLNESVLGKASKSNLEAQIKKGQAKLTAMKSELEKEQAGLQKQSGVLSASALEARKEALGKKQVEFQRAYEDLQASFVDKTNPKLQKLWLRSMPPLRPLRLIMDIPSFLSVTRTRSFMHRIESISLNR